MKRVCTCLLAVGLALVASGCATEPPANLQSQNTAVEPPSQAIDGLDVSLQPITDKKEVKRIFKVNLLAEGVLPVRLTAENRNTSASFMIAEEKVQIIGENTATAISSQEGQVAKSGTVSRGQQLLDASFSPALMLLTAMSPPPGDLVNSFRQYELGSKEFYSRTLGPGERAEGYSYFQLPKSSPISGAYQLVAPIKNVSTGVVTPCQFKFTLNSKEK